MNAVSDQGAPRGRVQLVLLALLFFVPLLVSYILYFWFPEYRPSGTTNYGQLVDPAQSLPLNKMSLKNAQGETLEDVTLLGRWTYLILADDQCDEVCMRSLIMSRQVRLALNEKRSRVQHVLVVNSVEVAKNLSDQLAAEHPQLLVIADLGEDQRLDQILKPDDASLYLIDPHGNWLMAYPPLVDTPEGTLADFKGIRKDIKKLLRLSQIG